MTLKYAKFLKVGLFLTVPMARDRMVNRQAQAGKKPNSNHLLLKNLS